jgi:hypothetical protein
MAWTSPRTWVTSETVTAALLNTHVRDNLKAIGDAWGSYTPTISWTLGNGTLVGSYMQAGKLVHYHIKLTIGSTTSPSSTLQLGLPVARSDTTARCPAGNVGLTDASGPTFYSRFAAQSGASAIVLQDLTGTLVTATVPFTFATGDIVMVEGAYEAA